MHPQIIVAGHVCLDIIPDLKNIKEDLNTIFKPGTSYTVVLNPKGIDRMFLHYPGANDSFKNNDINFGNIEGGKIFHFGYPPLMRQMYLHNGKELVNLMKRAKQSGFVTSLDMAFPDPNSEAGQINWKELLRNVLPHIDIFLPSLDEIAFMLKYENDAHSKISEIAKMLLNMGAGIVGLKLGDLGFYLRTSPDKQRLAFLRKCGYTNINSWANQELLSTCFKVNVVGTTGAGDSTIAGFLAALVKKQGVTDAINSAVGVGACNVEALDAVEGIPTWEIVQSRIINDWEKHPLKMVLDDWGYLEEKKVWIGHNLDKPE